MKDATFIEVHQATQALALTRQDMRQHELQHRAFDRAARREALVFAVQGWKRLPAYVGAYLLIWALNALALRALLAGGMGELVAQALILPATVALSWWLIGRVMGFHRAGRQA